MLAYIGNSLLGTHWTLKVDWTASKLHCARVQQCSLPPPGGSSTPLSINVPDAHCTPIPVAVMYIPIPSRWKGAETSTWYASTFFRSLLASIGSNVRVSLLDRICAHVSMLLNLTFSQPKGLGGRYNGKEMDIGFVYSRGTSHFTLQLPLPALLYCTGQYWNLILFCIPL
jgi:hypothetical protein